MSKIAEVIVDISHSDIDRVFDYIIPEGFNAVPGERVRVPFGKNRYTEGYIIRIKDESGVPADRLKAVDKRLDEIPVLTRELTELALWVAEKYHSTKADAIRLMLPPIVGKKMVSRKTKRMVGLAKTPEELSEELEGIRDQTAKIYKVTEYLIINKTAEKATLNQLFGNVNSTVKTLCARGWLCEYDEVVTRSPYLDLGSKPDSVPKLKSAQAEIIKEVNKAIDGGKGSFLLKGVTGSGKTEVYLHVIAHALDKGLSAIVLVPEISLTPQMLSRFRARFGHRVAVLHSALSLGERADEWRRIYSGEADVVVGARSAVFAPVNNLGLIIIDEEHESSYRSEMTPKYITAEIAHKRLEQRGVILLGSATPSIERFYMAQTGKYKLLRLDDRINNKPLPEVRLVDMREEFRLGNRGIFSECLKEKLDETLNSGGQAILFLNRRGFSTFVMCRECGHVMGCGNCDAQLTYHRHSDRLLCHYCGAEYPVPALCPECGSRYIKYFGTGTEKIEEEVAKLFPQARVTRMDMDTVAAKDSHMHILTEFASGKKNVLVGTQMVTKGLDFPNVMLVGVIAADIGLYMPDYRSAERTFQLITQVGGRAGRNERDGTVIVQTYSPEHYSIALAAKHDYDGFYKYELEMRRRSQFPPFGDYVRAVFSSSVEESARICAIEAKERFGDYIKGFKPIYFGASRAPMGKLKGVYRWQVILRIARDDKSDALIRDFINVCDNSVVKNVFVSVDVNPANLL